MADVCAGPSSSSDSGPCSSKMATAADKRSERLKKLRELHMKRAEGSRLNHVEVVEEHKRSKLPKTWMKKKEIADKKLQEISEKEELGDKYDRVKFLETQADEAIRWERKEDKKRNRDTGFSSYEASTARQYERLTKALAPDMNHYQRLKEEVGEEVFYAQADTVTQGILPKDAPEKIDQLVQDLEKQKEKRSKYSRRRAYDPDADVDFINERNSKFNKKLDRFYGKYTRDIKDNLERGTAL